MKEEMKRNCIRIAGILLEMLYPHTCPFCGRVTKESVCASCSGKIIYVKEPCCKKCGKPVQSDKAEYCYDCGHIRHDYDRGFGLLLHRKPVPHSIYQFKYHNRRIYSRFYAQELAKHYEMAVRRWKIDLILPIPLYQKKRKERGYNQAELLAKDLSRQLSIPADLRSLRRMRRTEPQKHLDAKRRRDNLRNAFAVSDKFVPVKSALLVDDIYTTGSTIDGAAYALKQAGVQKVYFLAISIGQGY